MRKSAGRLTVLVPVVGAGASAKNKGIDKDGRERSVGSINHAALFVAGAVLP